MNMKKMKSNDTDKTNDGQGKIPASVIIHTHNAEAHLREVIDKLRDFEEIMIADMESRDNTLVIARQNGCTIRLFPCSGYAESARGEAMRLARNRWVFFVDADELIPGELTDWIRDFLKDPGEYTAVCVARKNCLLDSWKRDDYPDYQMRLLDRDHSSWPQHIHARSKTDGKIYRIPASRKELAMIHMPPRIEEVMERMNRYTRLELERRHPKRPSLLTLMLKPWFRFFKSYVLKGGFRSGVAGYVSAKSDAAYKFYLLAKQYEQSLNSDNLDAR